MKQLLHFMLLFLVFFSCKKKEENPIVPISKITTLEGIVVNSADNQPVDNIPIYLAKFDKQGNVISYSFDDKDTTKDFKPILMSDSKGKFKISFEAKDIYNYSFYAGKWTDWSHCNSLWECGTTDGTPYNSSRDDDFQRRIENKNLVLRIDPTAFFYFKEKQTGIYDTMFTHFRWNSCDQNGYVESSPEYYKGHFRDLSMLLPVKRPFTLQLKGKKGNKIIKDTLIQFQGINKGDTLFYPIFY